MTENTKRFLEEAVKEDTTSLINTYGSICLSFGATSLGHAKDKKEQMAELLETMTALQAELKRRAENGVF